MAAFQVKIKQVRKQQEEINKTAGELNSLAEEINAVKASLSFRGEYRANIVSNLGRIAGNCMESGKTMLIMGNALGQVLDKYEKTETRIVERASSPLKWTDYMIAGNAVSIGGLASGIGGIYIGVGGTTGHRDASASASASWYQDGEWNPYAGAQASAEAVWKSGKVEARYGDISAEASGSLGYASADASAEAGLMKDGEFSPHARAEANAEAGVAKGSASIEGKYGDAALTGSFLSAGAHAGISLDMTDENGNFNPSFSAEAEAKASVLSGQMEGKLGNDQFNMHGGAAGDLVGAGANAGIAISAEEIKMEAGAEAYLAKGEVTGGFSLFGIKIDTTLEGKAGAVGGSVGFDKTATSVEIGAGLSALLGVGIDVAIDWSEFELPEFDLGNLW